MAEAVVRVIVRRAIVRVVRNGIPVSVGGGGGVTAHTGLTALAWTSSGHTGTASRVAGFSGAGAAAEYVIGTGAGQIAAGDHAHAGVYDPAGTAAAAVAAHEAASDPHPGYLTEAAAAGAYQPLDSDLTAIAALSTTSYGRALLELANAAAGRTALALGGAAVLEVGTTAGTVAAGDHAHAGVYQPADAGLTSAAAYPTAADRYLYSTAADTWAEGTITSYARTLLSDTTAAAARATLGLGVTQTLTDAATISVDWASGDVATVTLGGARTLGTPTNGVAGRTYILIVNQDPTGDRSLDLPSAFVQKPEVRRQASQTTVLCFYCDGSSYHHIGDGWVRIPATADTSDSTPADTAVTGVEFTPIAGATYEVRAVKVHTSAAATTGCQWRVDYGNAATWATWGVDQSTTATAQLVHFNAGNTTNILATGTTGTGPGVGVLMGAFTAHASAPSAVRMRFQTEVAASAVTVKATLTALWIRRVA